MPDPTPGQVNYVAFKAALPDRAYYPAPAWDTVSVVYQRAWEAAAQAVRTDRPVFRYALGVQVQWGSEQDVWTIEVRRWTEHARMPAFAEYGIRRPGDRLATWAYEVDLTAIEETETPCPTPD